MSVPSHPEEHRLASLRNLAVLDTEPESAFDAIARMATQVCGVPIAMVTLVDAQRQWFKANVGLPGLTQTPRDLAFCDYVIQSAELLEVPDARDDPRFRAHPMVAGEPGIRFYAGAPLRLADGATVGALCVMDRKPHSLTSVQRTLLGSLCDIVVETLELRRSLLEKTSTVRSVLERNLAEREAHFRSLVESQTELVSVSAEDGEILYVNPRYAAFFCQPTARMVGASLYDLSCRKTRKRCES